MTLYLWPYPTTTYKVYRSFESSLSLDFRYQVICSQPHLSVAVFAYKARGISVKASSVRYSSPRLCYDFPATVEARHFLPCIEVEHKKKVHVTCTKYAYSLRVTKLYISYMCMYSG